MKLFTKLAQANVDHYNNHPTAHNAATAAYGAFAVVAIHKLAKRISKTPN